MRENEEKQYLRAAMENHEEMSVAEAKCNERKTIHKSSSIPLVMKPSALAPENERIPDAAPTAPCFQPFQRLQ
jgi:hypothetical protein